MTDRTSRAVAPVSAVCAAFRTQLGRVPAGSHKTGRCADVRECLAELQHRSQSACGRLSAEEKPQAARQPAMDLSRDKNAEEMKWSPLEMGAAMQAHGA